MTNYRKNVLKIVATKSVISNQYAARKEKKLSNWARDQNSLAIPATECATDLD